METHDGMQPDRDDAARMLAAAREAEEGTKNPPLRWSFFIAQAALLAAICAAQLLPIGPARAITILGLIAVVAIGVRSVFARPGYGLVWPDGPGAFPYMVAMFVVVGVPALLAVALELPWLWLVAALCAAVATLEMGRRYRKAVGRV